MKRLLQLTFALSTFAPLAASTPAPASDSLVAKTDKGDVRGALVPDAQVRVFKGIPFAAPPVGDLRWQPPQPASKWQGVRDATQYGKHCLQLENVFHTFQDAGPGEDCLTLNVWAPADAKKRNLPVMVWIYGGGFRAGTSAEPRQTGEVLARKDVVVVSMNYRLGIFGFFVHPELTAESPHHASGDYGLLDQAAALDWIQRNIAAFGGDPRNVTIFGQSAGSIAVSMLMASPLSRNSFQKAIGQSGGAFSGSFEGSARSAREQTDMTYAQAAFHTSTLADLRKIPADELLKQTLSHNQELHSSNPFGPVVDGWFLPESAPRIFAEGKQAHVPLLAGWTADEQRGQVTLAKVQPTAASFKAKAEAEFGPDTAEFLKLYPAGTDAEAVRSEGDLVDDRFICYSTWRWLDAQVATGNAPVYRYRFDLGSPGDKLHLAAIGAFHSDDIEYAFGKLDARESARWRPEDRALSSEMVDYWTNFARTGNPNGDGLPDWPAYKAASNWQVMHLDAVSQARSDTQRARYVFLTEKWGTTGGKEPQANRTRDSAPRPE